jgi:Protein of unknown function (DUF1644)
MPKERRDKISRPTPYHAGCSSSRSVRHSTSSSTEIRTVHVPEPVITPIEAKEYDEARCPVCMDHPHNAVLLQCTSSQNGCHAFMCDTSYRHSNCLDQFRRSNDASDNSSGEAAKLSCPLCRGSVTGWTVVQSARNYMNLKSRNCSSELCGFTGTYGELRKHAREMHPNTRPSEADPERMRDWRRMERERDIGDLFSVLGEEEVLGGGGRYLSFPPFAIFLIVHVLSEDGMRTVTRSVGGADRSLRSSRSSSRGQRRRRRVLWGESVNDLGDEFGSADREADDSYDEGGSDPQGDWGRRRPRRRFTMAQSDDDSEV